VLIRLLSSYCQKYYCYVHEKSILGKSPKVKDSIEDPFK